MFLLILKSVALFPCIPRWLTRFSQNAQIQLHPEQAASFASLLFYGFMDGVIFDARKVAHLPADQMPALPDYDDASYLREKAFPVRCFG